MREHNYFVYIVSNKSRRLYTGVTNNLRRRTYQHKHKLIRGFTSEYSFDMLVYYEHYSDIRTAISREKQIKGGRVVRSFRWYSPRTRTGLT